MYEGIDIATSDFSYIMDDGVKLIGWTWKIDTRIELPSITTEDYENILILLLKKL